MTSVAMMGYLAKGYKSRVIVLIHCNSIRKTKNWSIWKKIVPEVLISAVSISSTHKSKTLTFLMVMLNGVNKYIRINAWGNFLVIQLSQLRLKLFSSKTAKHLWKNSWDSERFQLLFKKMSNYWLSLVKVSLISSYR